ncbi:hypothetical protein [Brucella oryzae]|uniref:DUF4145 domain-containing protein n=1 Tax=Brucella oryzae TaxID=335286 RepID=A0A2S7IZT8_9HYPH|nr:hypothetical protein [Brucella oryzae]PQA73515.1 hypothetical protein C3731_11265 [Brucella oryzae]
MEDISLDLGEVISEHEPDTKRLAAAFFSDDDIGALIRCHFEVERAAIHALEIMTQGRWKTANCRYLNDKLNILEVIGAPPALLAPARILNKHRNSLAHSGIDIITREQEHEFTASVRRFFPQYTLDSKIDFRGTQTFNGTINDCSHRQRYVISASFLTMAMSSIPKILAKYFERINNESQLKGDKNCEI